MRFKSAFKISFILLTIIALIIIIRTVSVFFLISMGNDFVFQHKYKNAMNRYSLAYKISNDKKVYNNYKQAKAMVDSQQSYADGLEFLSKKDYQKAYDAFKKVLPEDLNYKYAQEKLPNLEDIIHLNNDIKRSIDQFEKGLQFYNENNLEKALEYLTTVINEDPNYKQTQDLIFEIRKKLNKDTPKVEENNTVIVPPRRVTYAMPQRRSVSASINFKPYGYSFGNDFNNYNGSIQVEVFVINTDTATAIFISGFQLKPGDAIHPPIQYNGMSDYRVKTYYNGELVEVHNLTYYENR